MGNDEARRDQNLVKILVDLWMHQNQLMWSRVQLLVALQGAVFAANYALANPAASSALLMVAIIATLYLAYIWDVDRIIRNKYSHILASKYEIYIGYTPPEREKISSDVIPGLDLPIIANSKTSLRVIFGFLVVCDLLVLVISEYAFWSN